VFIGILDPNQGVRGKGLWELQSRGIEVELFPPKLARQIRVLNEKFIKAQLRLGIRITNLISGQPDQNLR
jgi:pyrimidine deaminase RibD-like protein